MCDIVRKIGIDVLLVFGFAVQHSLMAALFFKGAFKKSFVQTYYRTFYTICSCVYIWGAYFLWQTIDIPLYTFEGMEAIVIKVLGVIAWGSYFLIHLFSYDLDTAFGVGHIVYKREFGTSAPQAFINLGLRKYIRLPIHTAFILMWWSIPDVTLDIFIFAVFASIYTVVGSVFQDNRYKKIVGETWEIYQRETGMILPRFTGKRERALSQNNIPRTFGWFIPGIISGMFFLGVMYYFQAFLSSRSLVINTCIVLGTQIVLGIMSAGLGFFFFSSFRPRFLEKIIPTSLWSSNAGISSIITSVTFYMLGYIPLLFLIPLWILGLLLGSYTLYMSVMKMEALAKSKLRLQIDS